MSERSWSCGISKSIIESMSADSIISAATGWVTTCICSTFGFLIDSYSASFLISSSCAGCAKFRIASLWRRSLRRRLTMSSSSLSMSLPLSYNLSFFLLRMQLNCDKQQAGRLPLMNARTALYSSAWWRSLAGFSLYRCCTRVLSLLSYERIDWIAAAMEKRTPERPPTLPRTSKKV